MIMKKEYIAPALFEVIIASQPIMVGSGEIVKTDDAATVTPGEGEYNGNDWASRRHSQWDDEDE